MSEFKVEQLDSSPATPPTPEPAAPAPATPPSSIPPSRPSFEKVRDRLNHPGSNRVLKWLVVVALGLFVTTLLMFWFGSASFAEKDVVLLLEAPSQANSGDQISYKIKYKNNTKSDLHNLQFQFFFPEDSIVIKDDGSFSDDVSEGFSLDSLSSGQEGEKELKAFLVGDKGNIKNAKVELVFKAGTIRSSFEKSQTATTTIVGVPVPMTLVAPPTAVPEQDVTYILDYRNESNADISDLRFEFTYPEGFRVKSTSPKGTQGNTVWDVASIKQGTGARISITGSLTGSERDTKTLSVLLKRKIGDQFVNYERASSSTILSSPLITASLSVNGNRDYVAFPNDSLVYTIKYRNNSTYSLEGLNLTAKLEGDMLEMSTLDTRGGFFDASTKTITWNSGVVPELQVLGPGRSGQVQFQVRLKPTISGSGSKNFFVKVTSTLSTPNVPSGLDNDQVTTSDVLVTKISTQPQLSRVAYWSDPNLGSVGPMPPQVSKETVFTIHWQLSNPGNDTTGVVIKAVLPPGVKWKNVALASGTANSPIFNANRSEVSWNVGLLPQGTGVSGSPKFEGVFQISVTPSSAQQGKIMELIKPATLTGTDSFTNQTTTVTIDGVTTDNTVDRPGQGTVL
ncbi:MAG: hypothetical protein KW806_00385 [Candidatus Yanofskybacteria bacterium]|nr:hypothetical protein [Candidatus Yanofskybacteria bacterium]